MIKEIIEIENDTVASRLFGPADQYLNILNDGLSVDLVARGHSIILRGHEQEVAHAKQVLEILIKICQQRDIAESDVRYAFALQKRGLKACAVEGIKDSILITAHGRQIRAKTLGQQEYLNRIMKHTITFGIGPAGTGKTYLAVIMAVRALKRREVSRIVLTRPAVEAGEKLGFLPGDLQEKVDPYLRPLYDGLYDTLGQETAQRYLEKGIIEIAPLAYMRGRTLDESFIILDEAQNTTSEQMKMFLTRIGYGSRAVVTGDMTQIDLPRRSTSGLIEAKGILQDIPEIAFVTLEAGDVVRHPVVAKIVQAYDQFEQEKEKQDEIRKNQQKQTVERFSETD